MSILAAFLILLNATLLRPTFWQGKAFSCLIAILLAWRKTRSQLLLSLPTTTDHH